MKPSELIETVGWCQNRARVFDRLGGLVGVCLVTAITEAYPKAENWENVSIKVRGALEKLGAQPEDGQGPAGPSMSRWNDAWGRRKEEVIALLKSVGE